MDTPVEAAKLKVQRSVYDWESAMSLEWLEIKHVFDEGFAEDSDTFAETSASWEYRGATITWYLGRLAASEPEEVDKVVLHELIHCLTAPMESLLKDKDSKLKEFTVESLARAIYSVRHTPNSPKWIPR